MKEQFNQNNYLVAKQAISKEVASLAYHYIQNKRSVASFLLDNKYLSPFDKSWGTWKDAQIPDTYSHYGDVLMETLMSRVLPLMKEVTGLSLIPCYTYTRIYKYGDVLHRHKDRASCEISCTMNLGGDDWPIYLDPTGEEGNEGIKVDLDPGDMLVYRGVVLEHWREPFQGHDCGQVFMHYNDKNGEYGESNLFDKRPMLGLPEFCK